MIDYFLGAVNPGIWEFRIPKYHRQHSEEWKQIKGRYQNFVKSLGTNMNMKAYPSIFIIRLRRSNSDPPGNNGSPKNNSATMHPKDHMSIAVVYLDEELSSNCNSMSWCQIWKEKKLGLKSLNCIKFACASSHSLKIPFCSPQKDQNNLIPSLSLGTKKLQPQPPKTLTGLLPRFIIP